MYWTLELASKLEDAPWPATKEELIDYAIRSGSPLEVLENLQEIFAEMVWQKGEDGGETDCEVSARHSGLLSEALSAVEQSIAEVSVESWELAALQLRRALFALGTVTGEDASPDILDEIFSRFCIGK